MAVYTEVTDEELTAFARLYDIGEVLSCKGIAEGVENSNYLLGADAGQYILTLYEKRVKPGDLPFFLGLMEHLAAKGVAAPVPIRALDGNYLQTLCGRPAAIVTFLSGMWPKRVQPTHCGELGRAMADLHLAGADFSLVRGNALSVASWRPLLEACGPGADALLGGLVKELSAELAELEANWPRGLPAGVIHADLFPDNVFFRGDRLSGLIDFYFACNDALAYDIAICLNAWCFEADRSFNITKARRLLGGYQSRRALSPGELEALPWLARGSAMRFLLTRLFDWMNTPADALVIRKDPLEYLDKLRFHRGLRGPGAYGLD